MNLSIASCLPEAADQFGRDDFGKHPLLHLWLGREHTLPSLAQLEQARLAAQAIDGVARPAIRAQTRTLLDDGCHYEQRIADGILATREHDAHDAFNARVWLRHPQLKHALNLRQVADIARVGTKRRTRGQCALTHFDEAGAIVWMTDDAPLRSWDAHDWHGLFVEHRAAWGSTVAVTVFGHALIEHVWKSHELPVAKALAVRVSSLSHQHIDDGALLASWSAAEMFVAERIAASELLTDPQELRPLPLAGIPGWHADNSSQRFYFEAPCFRPLRAGRCYPKPLLSPSEVKRSARELSRRDEIGGAFQESVAGYS